VGLRDAANQIEHRAGVAHGDGKGDLSSGNSAEAHRLQPWEEARKLRETIHRLQHCRLPDIIQKY